MVQHEQKTLDDTVSPQHKSHQKIKSFDNKHFLIHRIRRHLVTQFSVANDKKYISQVCRTIYESYIQFRSITKKFTNFKVSMIKNTLY
jgi:hypothetical protein